uniref:E2F/DP family winged-helix DNA-binding domain-containing protein n=1 Tax=Fundulus heteroclitus TaxID=8078 RepID=A0A3Q2PTA9_FUNHE
MCSAFGFRVSYLGLFLCFFPPTPTAGCRFEKSNRMDNSLVLLTQKFAQMITHSFDGVLDLNLVSSELNVRKRRLYDITNVLEGIQLIRKTHKNHFQWGGSLDNRVAGELKDLIAEEEKLDELIQIISLTLWITYAYVTYEDVRGVLSLDEQAVMVIKAPPGTKLQVPHPEESLQMHLSSVSGPIEVFLCADTPVPMESTDAAAAGGAGSGQSSPQIPKRLLCLQTVVFKQRGGVTLRFSDI